MDLLQIREKEIFSIASKLKNLRFIVIGGYATNAYTLPRYSADFDIVVDEIQELNKIENILQENNYKKTEIKKNIPYHGKFLRYKKEIQKNFNVSIDILFKEVLDRQTGQKFDADWIFSNSNSMELKGKTVLEKIRLNIVNCDALIVMKFITCRIADIRDVFMLTPQAKDLTWVKEEINKKYSFKDRFAKIRGLINSKTFKQNLEGVYGYIDEKIFEKYKKAIMNIEN